MKICSVSINDEEQVEYDRWRVAKSYTKSWFLLDIVSGVPFAALELIIEATNEGITDASGKSSSGALSSAKSLKLLRFLKLGRLFKIEKILSNLDRDSLGACSHGRAPSWPFCA